MKLYLDIGNTMLKCGLDNDCDIKFLFRIFSNEIEDKFLITLNKFINLDEVDEIIISSVVPHKLNFIKKILKDKKIYVISPLDNSNINLKIDDPKELGSDLFCDLVGAKDKYDGDLLIVDLGTVSKFLYLDNQGTFSSCAFTPGIGMSLKMMSNQTALLPDTSIKDHKKLIDCHNTVDVLTSSAYYSHVSMVNGIIKEYLKEINQPTKIILTGGNGELLKDTLEFEYIFDEYLCLYGMKIITMLRREKNED